MTQCADAKHVINTVNAEGGSTPEEVTALTAIQNVVCDGLTDLELETASCKADKGDDWLTCSDVTCDSGLAPTEKCYSPHLKSLAWAFSDPNGDEEAKMAPTDQCVCPAPTPCQAEFGQSGKPCSEVTCGTGLQTAKQCYNSALEQPGTDQCACSHPCDIAKSHIATIKSADPDFNADSLAQLQGRVCAPQGGACEFTKDAVRWYAISGPSSTSSVSSKQFRKALYGIINLACNAESTAGDTECPDDHLFCDEGCAKFGLTSHPDTLCYSKSADPGTIKYQCRCVDGSGNRPTIQAPATEDLTNCDNAHQWIGAAYAYCARAFTHDITGTFTATNYPNFYTSLVNEQVRSLVRNLDNADTSYIPIGAYITKVKPNPKSPEISGTVDSVCNYENDLKYGLR